MSTPDPIETFNPYAERNKFCIIGIVALSVLLVFILAAIALHRRR